MSSNVVTTNLLRLLGLLAGLCMAGATLAADTLIVSQSMTPGQYLASADASHRFTFQTDGNLVVRRTSNSQVLWASATNGQGGTRLTLQSDGNLVLYTNSNNALWSSKTAGTPANRLVMQNDGDLVIYSTSNTRLWSTATGGTTPPPTGGVSKVDFVLRQVTGYGRDLSITRPSTVQTGDLLVLITQGGDGQLPDTQSGWTRFASCFERTNSDTTCSASGGDLGLVAYYRVASTSGSASYTIDSGASGHVTAAILVLRGANNANPIYSHTYLPNDGKSVESHCPSTAGVAGGYHVCTYSHDDPQKLKNFSPLSLLGWIRSDGDGDSAHVSSRALGSGGNTPYIVSANDGDTGGGNNDLQLSFVVRPAP